MAKKLEVPEVEVFKREYHAEKVPELNNVAISIVATGDKKYSVIKIKFDLNTGNVGTVEVVQEGLDLYESQHRFKILSVTEGLFN